LADDVDSILAVLLRTVPRWKTEALHLHLGLAGVLSGLPSPTKVRGDDAGGSFWGWRDWAAALFLFSATAAVVFWQNGRLAVLWDVSYILENSYRISLGQLPYRDFPFPYAPGTFLIQALLMRLTGRVFFHHVVYCAVVGGAGTVLTWRILLHLVQGTFIRFRLIAFLLALPLTVLGIYCVFPHPFYDPDCTFAILCCVSLLLSLGRKGFPPLFSFFAGAACVAPVFVKQNTGIAFLVAAALAVTALSAIEMRRRGPQQTGLMLLLAGMGAALGACAFLLHIMVGLHNYIRWTVSFAAARRLPGINDMLTPFANVVLPVWLAAFAAGAALLRRSYEKKKWYTWLALALMSAPFAWPVIYLFLEDDTAERAERLLALWPFLLLVSVIPAIRSLTHGASLARILPFVLVATVAGAFLSQQLWGSTYAIWPLLMILFAGALVEIFSFAGQADLRAVQWFVAMAAACVLVAGGFYVASHERLNYADVGTGEMAHSSIPALRGLSMRGEWLPEFEELVRFSDRAIPRDEGLLMIPGEDLFYYATGRTPQFPVLMFDHTVNPYSPEQIVELARQRGVCWLVVKKRLQIGGEPVEDRDRLLGQLRADFLPVQKLTNYEIYRRRNCAAFQ